MIRVVRFWAVKIGMILCSEHCIALLTEQASLFVLLGGSSLRIVIEIGPEFKARFSERRRLHNYRANRYLWAR